MLINAPTPQRCLTRARLAHAPHHLPFLQGADNASREAYATLDNVKMAMGFGTLHGRRPTY